MKGSAVALAFMVLSAPLAKAADAPPPQQQGLAGAAAQSNGQPIHIEADTGIEWQQQNHVYIARGNATATRGDDTVKADTLTAFYRLTANAQTPPSPPPSTKSSAEQPLGGGPTEIYRLEADGHVIFTTPTQTLTADNAVYDLDQALLVATGTDLKLTTPRDTITARDSMEWYDRQQMGVARGNAIAVSGDRRVSADVLTAHVTKDPTTGTSRISRIDANGNVVVSSPDQIARGDDGVYDLATGIATLEGHVSLTRGQNELRGRYAVVDLNTNVSRLLSEPPGTKVTGPPPRVVGLIVPRRKPDQPADQPPPQQPDQKP
ncbi:MAG TPA: LptA/OstA family protein [Stellaceae bacterium]|nr:LptA/OstA family protein [Stellaceae bacterium]